MIGFDLTDEQLQLQKQMRAFAREEIAPFAAEIDRRPDNLFDFNVIRRIAKANLLSLNVPTEYGGKGMTPLNAVIIAEELGAACLGTTMIGGGTWLATTCINLVGTEEQKKRYLPLVCGENAQLAAFAATEPESGSDIASIKTLAVRKGDHYILNGFKTHITNAGTAGFYVVLATTNPGSRHRGLNAFIVDGDARGLSLSATEDLMGLRVCQNGSLALKDVHVPCARSLLLKWRKKYAARPYRSSAQRDTAANIHWKSTTETPKPCRYLRGPVRSSATLSVRCCNTNHLKTIFWPKLFILRWLAVIILFASVQPAP